ncbi:GlxA family transcriptional regulator [Undibacterium danionis]|uniref:GlxA family transcriptional regulator n=1 Tax=Undibacterium danionis TaxID=1812100 RepID=A0ABV6IFH0_9BURK
MKTFLIIVTEGMMDSSLAITLDILRTAAFLLERNHEAQSLRILTAAHRKKVKTGAGLILECDFTLQQLLTQKIPVDWLLLPGSGKKVLSELEASLSSKEVQQVMSVLNHYAEEQTCLSVSCASTFMLAEAGLLDGRAATTSWWLANAFRQRYPAVVLDETKMLVRDANILTAGAVFSQMDVVLDIVAEVAGASIAYLCSRYLLIEQRSSQARFMIPTQNQHLDPIVIAAEKWIDKHIEQALTVQELAAQFSVSAKTLSRKIQTATGDSPIKFIQRRKLMRAVHLLESTKLPVELVAEKVGYQNGTMLRHLIKRELGVLPSRIR